MGVPAPANLNRDRWMKNLYWTNDAFKSSTNFEHIKTHYYWSHTSVRFFFTRRCLVAIADVEVIQINPTRVVPVGPVPHVQPL